MSSGWDWIVAALYPQPRFGDLLRGRSRRAGLGVGDLTVLFEAPQFELFRAVSGRRTAKEIEQYGWDREPAPSVLLAADFFSIPADSIGE